MGRYDGSLRVLNEESGLGVVLDLTTDRIVIRTSAEVLGEWSLSSIGIRGEDDGFHLRIEGEEFVVTTTDDPGFALEIGLRSASPAMRRRISAALRTWDAR